MTAEEIARAVLRAYFGDPIGFRDMGQLQRKRAVEAAEDALASPPGLAAILAVECPAGHSKAGTTCGGWGGSPAVADATGFVCVARIKAANPVVTALELKWKLAKAIAKAANKGGK